MASISIHALEGSMLSNSTGALRLLDIAKKGTSTEVFVISPVSSPELSLDGLLSASAENDEKLWSRLEKSQSAWNELADKLQDNAHGRRQPPQSSAMAMSPLLLIAWTSPFRRLRISSAQYGFSEIPAMPLPGILHPLQAHSYRLSFHRFSRRMVFSRYQ